MRVSWIASALLMTAATLTAQSGEVRVPPLPVRHDTLTIAYGSNVIGRGIMTWRRVGGDHLQVYAWTSVLDGSSVTDSLFSDPQTLIPVREVRTVGDTLIQVLFARDTVFVTTIIAGHSSTAWALAPADVMYSSASLEALAATMPFTRGAARSVLTFYAPPSKQRMRYTAIRVEAEEMIQGRRAWRVMHDSPGGATTYWIDAVTRAVLQSDVREGDAIITFRRYR